MNARKEFVQHSQLSNVHQQCSSATVLSRSALLRQISNNCSVAAAAAAAVESES